MLNKSVSEVCFIIRCCYWKDPGPSYPTSLREAFITGPLKLRLETVFFWVIWSKSFSILKVWIGPGFLSFYSLGLWAHIHLALLFNNSFFFKEIAWRKISNGDRYIFLIKQFLSGWCGINSGTIDLYSYQEMILLTSSPAQFSLIETWLNSNLHIHA